MDKKKRKKKKGKRKEKFKRNYFNNKETSFGKKFYHFIFFISLYMKMKFYNLYYTFIFICR